MSYNIKKELTNIDTKDTISILYYIFSTISWLKSFSIMTQIVCTFSFCEIGCEKKDLNTLTQWHFQSHLFLVNQSNLHLRYVNTTVFVCHISYIKACWSFCQTRQNQCFHKSLWLKQFYIRALVFPCKCIVYHPFLEETIKTFNEYFHSSFLSLLL